MNLIPDHILASSEKILFITHLAIGDFTYLQNFFSAFAKANPHIKIHLWIDELRKTADQSQWESLKKYSLYDWAESCNLFHSVYRQTYSPELLKESIQKAQQENYPVVVSLATLRPQKYARLARLIAKNAFIVGIKQKARWFAPWDNIAYAQLDASFAPFSKPPTGYHITDVYSDWFEQLCGLQVHGQQRFPFIDIPEQWKDSTQNQLNDWKITDEAIQQEKKIIFINAYAKTKKRCWPLLRVAELIVAMGKLPEWQNASFIVNAMPQDLDNAKKILANYSLSNTHFFSANTHFFQLPALLQRCDLIISVETAVMHLANAVHVPVIALMRQKNPEWTPIDREHSFVITTKRRNEWVKSITADQVINACFAFYRQDEKSAKQARNLSDLRRHHLNVDQTLSKI